MTRPIYEPTLTRTDAQLGYGSDQLFRRPAPTSTANSFDVIHMYSWNYDTVNTVANETWTNICGLGGSDGFFETVFHSSGWSSGWNCATGGISMSISAEYLLQGWVQFNEDANVGEQRFIAVDFGASLRHQQEYVADTFSTQTLAEHLPVHTFYFGTGTPHISVYHNHGSDLTIRGAEFKAQRGPLESEGTVESC